MALLTRDQFLSAVDCNFDYVNVPEWGDIDSQIKIKSLSLIEQMACDKIDDKDVAMKAATVISFGCINEDGSQFFNGPDDIPKLEEKSPSVVLRLFKAICKLSSINEDDIKEQSKNS